MSNVSVIIPTWNRVSTLERAIRSALEQTQPPLEVLVCDDGSTDESRAIVYSINDSRVRWIEGNHSGRPAVPRNRGIRASQGEWLAFLDSDDEWMPEKLEKQLAFLKKIRCEAACSNAIRFMPSRGISEKMFDRDSLGEKISFSALIQNNYVICSSVLISKDVVGKCHVFPEDSALIALEDYALWLRVATFTDFAFVNEPLLVYRDAPESSLRASNIKVSEQKINVFKSFISWANDTKYNLNNEENLHLVQKSLLNARIEDLKCRLIIKISRLKSWIINEKPSHN